MLRFCAAVTGMMQERTAFPSMITVHAPHWPSPQPNLGPCSSRSSRRTYKSGVVGSVSTTRYLLVTRSEIRAMRVSFLHRRLGEICIHDRTVPIKSAYSLHRLVQSGEKIYRRAQRLHGFHSALESSWPLAKTILSRCMIGLPSLAGLPMAVISLPGFSESLFQPALASMAKAPSSALHFTMAPFSSFTSK